MTTAPGGQRFCFEEIVLAFARYFCFRAVPLPMHCCCCCCRKEGQMTVSDVGVHSFALVQSVVLMHSLYNFLSSSIALALQQRRFLGCAPHPFELVNCLDALQIVAPFERRTKSLFSVPGLSVRCQQATRNWAEI